jgi:PilZ domain-containing protein
MATEKRKATRRNLERSCWIQFAPDRVIHSSIINISQTGTKSNLPEDIELPKRFDLLLTRDGSVARRVELAWRSDGTIGLKFVRDRVSRPVMPATDADAPATGAAT